MRKRITVVVLVALSLVVMTFLTYCFKAVLPAEWASGIRWQYALRVVLLLFPLSMMLLLRRPPALYGLNPPGMPRELGFGLAFAAILIGMTFLFGILIHAFTGARTSVRLGVSDVVFNLVCAGFCEELVFRGYCQGELNRVFDRPFAMGETRFGWPVFLAAGMFALVHMFSNFNPLHGRWQIDLLPLVYTFPAGVAFGIAREHFKGVLAVAILHGGSNLAFSLYDSPATKFFAEAAFWLMCFYLYRCATRDVPSVELNVAAE